MKSWKYSARIISRCTLDAVTEKINATEAEVFFNGGAIGRVMLVRDPHTGELDTWGGNYTWVGNKEAWASDGIVAHLDSLTPSSDDGYEQWAATREIVAAVIRADARRGFPSRGRQ